MARPPPKQLDPARRDWLRRHVAAELAVWERITRRLNMEGFDPRTAEYRQACDVHLALLNVAARHRPRPAGLWSMSTARAGEPLSEHQLDAIGSATMATIRELAPVVDYIDVGGFPCKLLAGAVRDAVDRCYTINQLLRCDERLTTGGGIIPEPPVDPTPHLGEGI